MSAAKDTMKTREPKVVERQAPHQCDELELADEKAGAQATMKLQRAASDRLQRLIDALEPELEQPALKPKGPEPDPKANGGKQQPEQQQKKGGIQAQDGIPGVAQLKALKAEQLEVNDRTKEFAQRHPDLGNLTREQQAELDGIRAEQEHLLELFREMITSAKAEGGKQQ